jgi:hypothetical protein
MSQKREGGCLCGAVRYSVEGDPVVVALCHCSVCRRSAGAPVVAWAMFPLAGFAYTAGKPAVYASSPGSGRTFCRDCGANVGFTSDNLPGLVDLTVASFDDPATLPPQVHIWDSKRLPWFATSDALPRFAEFPPGPPPQS